MPDRRRFLFSSLAAALVGACGSPPALAAGQLVQVQIVDRATGEIAPEHRHRGTTHVAGRPGDRYAVRLVNRSGARVLVVLSVDGVNAITGETAATSQSGYVLAPWQAADITGWRKSDVEAAAFYFTALPDSYAARTDRPHNVGVIGVAVFRERAPRPTPFSDARPPAPVAGARADEGESRSRDSGDGVAERGRASAAGSAAKPESTAPAAPAVRPERHDRAERLGTGHGEREVAPISRTTFERATSQPAEIVQIRYDSHRNLVAAGVIEPPHRHAPQPFPGYVPDPR